MTDSDIKVSVICNAYNHEPFIRDALEGFVMQKTNFKFEVLVHDDASTDGTADIIREYEKKYPELIKPIYQTENQYSKGNGAVGKIQRARAKGKYIAICEGDDYWTDPLKLQKQYDVLEAHPECDMCAHAAVMVKEFSKGVIGYVKPAMNTTILPSEDVIMGGGGYLATNSLMYRKVLNEAIPDFRNAMPCDYTLQIQGSLRGGIIYMCDCMSAYRIRLTGSWTSETMKSKERRVASWKRVINMLEVLNNDTFFQYDESIRKTILGAEVMIFRIQGNIEMIKKDPYKMIYDMYSSKEKLSMYLERYLPFVLHIWCRIKGKKIKT